MLYRAMIEISQRERTKRELADLLRELADI
jgi:hypothetical protein